jgi:hypothetical protein
MQAFFKVAEWDDKLGYEPCLPTRLPDQRRAYMGQLAASIFTDAEQTLSHMQIGLFNRYPSSLRLNGPLMNRYMSTHG